MRACASADSAAATVTRVSAACCTSGNVSWRLAVSARSWDAARVSWRGISSRASEAAAHTAALTPIMRNGRRSAFRALAASHCVIVAAGRPGGGFSVIAIVIY